MKIKLGRNNIANQSSYGKWYGRVKYESTLSEDELAKRRRDKGITRFQPPIIRKLLQVR